MSDASLMVTVQYQSACKPYAWNTAFRAKVLYADSKIILLRGAGSHSVFAGDGFMRMMAWHGESKFGLSGASRPRAHKGFRIAPTSMKRIKADIVFGGGKAPAF